MDTLVFKHARHRADQRVGISCGEAREHLHHLQVGKDSAEDLLVLHLPGHDGIGYAFGLERLDQLSQLPQRQPVNRPRVLLNIGRSLFLDRRNDHLDALTPCGLEHEEWKSAVAGDQAVSTW